MIEANSEGRAIRVLAVASVGGHLVQLRKLIPAFSACEVKFLIAAKPEMRPEVFPADEYWVDNISRDNFGSLFSLLYVVAKKVAKVKPQIVVSTGAGIGLVAIIIARVFGVRTIWIDSIANAARLSLSGRFASFFAHTTLTQWRGVAERNDRVEYWGRLL